MRNLGLLLCVFLPTWISGEPALSSPCYPVSSDWITAHDLAQAIPEFSKLRSDLTFGFTPMPGVERVFSVYEMQRIAKQNNIPAVIPRKTCFAWAVRSLEKERMLAAMRTSLDGYQSTIEILGQERALVPPGDVFFPLQGLTGFSEKPVVWNGYIAFSASRRFSTWALVRIRVLEPHWVARKAIRQGEAILPENFKSEEYEGPLLRERAVPDLRIAAQFRASRDIAAGATLVAPMLVLPADVQKGEIVTVIADSGAAHIEAQGLSAQAGSAGDIVLVKNPVTGRMFRARIVGKGRVLVIPGVLSGLVGREDKS